MLDVGGLDRFTLDDEDATVGPGLRNFPLYRKLARRGLAIPSGSCPNIAIGGLATGGGMGLAGRALGLTLDRVTAFDVVTADGERERVRAGDEPVLGAARRRRQLRGRHGRAPASAAPAPRRLVLRLVSRAARATRCWPPGTTSPPARPRR